MRMQCIPGLPLPSPPKEGEVNVAIVCREPVIRRGIEEHFLGTSGIRNPRLS